MKTKIILVIIFGLLSSLLFSQEPLNPNFIAGNIKVPIFVDQIETEDHFLDDRRDSNTKHENALFDIYTQLKQVPIYFWGKRGAFKGNFKEEIYDLVTEINISGNIDFKSNLGVITIQQKETKKAKSGVCDYDYEYSYKYEYKNLKVNKSFGFNKNTSSYTFKPDENTILTVSDYKYLEDTKCPKRNYSKEFIYKNINEDYLKEKLTQNYGSYFYFNINWDGEYLDDKLIKPDSIKITSIIEDGTYKSLTCNCPPFDNYEELIITYDELTNIILTQNNQISNVFPNVKSNKEILNIFDDLKKNLEITYGVKIETLSILENHQIKKDIKKSTIIAPLGIEGKDFCIFLKKIANLR
jgi:hypothetical protein